MLIFFFFFFFLDQSKIDDLTKQDLYDLLSAAEKESYLILDNSLYRQVDGVHGVLFKPIPSKCFLCHYEKERLDSCHVEFKPKLYKRYVDDIFAMFQSRDQVKKLHEHKTPEYTFYI